MKKSIEEMRELHQKLDKVRAKKWRFYLWWACSLVAAIWIGAGSLLNLNIPRMIGCLIFIFTAIACQCVVEHCWQQERDLQSEIKKGG